MSLYRTQVKIVADVLSAAMDNGTNEGVGITHLLRRANLSYARMVRILNDLVGSGLLETIEQERGHRYRTSDRGLQFLTAYGRFQDFAKSFGLRL